MDKIDQLWIRACKSNKRHVRLNSVYRRFYLGQSSDHDIAALLIELVHGYNLITAKELIYSLDPNNRRFYGLCEDDDYFKVCKHVLSSKIALTKVTDLPGLKSPARFRKKT